MNSVEERLAKLERRVNRYRNVVLILISLLTGIITAGATGNVSLGVMSDQVRAPFENRADVSMKPAIPKGNLPSQAVSAPVSASKSTLQTSNVIQTRRLEIVNSNGEVVLLLATSVDGDGLIFVKNKNDRTLCYIGSSGLNDDGVILLNSKEERNLVSMGADGDTRDGFLNIRNKEEHRLISLFAGGNEGGIWLNNTDNKNLFFAGGSSLGNGFMALSNRLGKTLFTMSTSDDVGSFWISNNDDKDVVFLGTDVTGQGLLKLNSSTGTELFIAGSNTSDNGLLRMSNKHGNLGFSVVAGENAGILRLKDAQEASLVILGQGGDGNGRIETLSPQGIETWSTSFGQLSSSRGLNKVGDLDGDGDIDPSDFLIFSENFGQ